MLDRVNLFEVLEGKILFLAFTLGTSKLILQIRTLDHINKEFVYKVPGCDNTSLLHTAYIKDGQHIFIWKTAYRKRSTTCKMQIIEKSSLYLLRNSIAIIINQIPYKRSLFQLRMDNSVVI